MTEIQKSADIDASNKILIKPCKNLVSIGYIAQHKEKFIKYKICKYIDSGAFSSCYMAIRSPDSESESDSDNTHTEKETNEDTGLIEINKNMIRLNITNKEIEIDSDSDLNTPPSKRATTQRMSKNNNFHNISEQPLHHQHQQLENNETFVAIKIVPLKTILTNKIVKQNVVSEIKILTAVCAKKKCDNVIEILDHFQFEGNMFTVLEYCAGKSLKTFLETKQINPNKCGETRCLIYMHQLLTAIKHLHENNIVHRDVKLGNILLTDCNATIKLADFGFAVYLHRPKEQRLQSIWGTPYFIAPEIVASTSTSTSSTNKGYSFPVDIWSAGICMFYMLFGYFPFSGKTKECVYEKLENNILQIPDVRKLSNNTIDLLSKILIKNPESRLTAAQALNHTCFKNIDNKIFVPVVSKST